MVISHTASSLRFSPRLVSGKYYFLRVGLIVLSTSIKALLLSILVLVVIDLDAISLCRAALTNL